MVVVTPWWSNELVLSMFSVNSRSPPCLFSVHSSGFQDLFVGDTLKWHVWIGGVAEDRGRKGGRGQMVNDPVKNFIS